MTSTNPQSLNQNTDRPRSTVGDAAQRSSRRPSQPRFVLQPVVLDDTAPSDTDEQRIELTASDESIEPEAIDAETRPRPQTLAPDESTILHDVGTRSGSQGSADRMCTTPPECHAPPPERLAIIGALVVCGAIAIALFIALLLTRMPPVA